MVFSLFVPAETRFLALLPIHPAQGPSLVTEAHLEVLQGFLQAPVVIKHHPPELQGLHVVLVEQQGLLKALGGSFEIAQFSRYWATVMSTLQSISVNTRSTLASGLRSHM